MLQGSSGADPYVAAAAAKASGMDTSAAAALALDASAEGKGTNATGNHAAAALVVALTSPDAALGAAASAPDVVEAATDDDSAHKLGINDLEEVFQRLPHNTLVLAVKSLSSAWHQWVLHKLGGRRALRLLLSKEDWGSSYVPFWAIKQQRRPLSQWNKRHLP